MEYATCRLAFTPNAQSLWRGNYRVRLRPPDERSVQVASLPRDMQGSEYRAWVRGAVNPGHDPLVVFGPGVLGLNPEAIGELASWLQLDSVGLVTGKILHADGRLLHGGMTLRRDGTPLFLFEGFPGDEPGYMAVTSIVRNVSVVHPCCFAIRRDVWTALGGLDAEFTSGYARWTSRCVRVIAAGAAFSIPSRSSLHAAIGRRASSFPSRTGRFFGFAGGNGWKGVILATTRRCRSNTMTCAWAALCHTATGFSCADSASRRYSRKLLPAMKPSRMESAMPWKIQRP